MEIEAKKEHSIRLSQTNGVHGVHGLVRRREGGYRNARGPIVRAIDLRATGAANHATRLLAIPLTNGRAPDAAKVRASYTEEQICSEPTEPKTLNRQAAEYPVDSVSRKRKPS